LIQGRTPCGVCPGACSAWRADPSAARHHAAPGPWSTSGQTRAAGKGNCVQPVFFVPGAEGRGSPCPRPWPPQRRRRAWQAVVVARGGLGTAHGRGAAPYAALQRQYGPSLHCRVKGKLDEQSVCPYKHGLACGPWVSRSRRPATALTAGRPLDGRWTAAGRPLDDRRALASWARMAPREQETRTWGGVAWSRAVCAEDRPKPVMDAYI